MDISRRDVLKLGVGGLAAGAIRPRPAAAAEFPAKPVTLICPWPPGGSTDVSMRALAEATSKPLGQPVVI